MKPASAGANTQSRAQSLEQQTFILMIVFPGLPAKFPLLKFVSCMRALLDNTSDGVKDHANPKKQKSKQSHAGNSGAKDAVVAMASMNFDFRHSSCLLKHLSISISVHQKKKQDGFDQTVLENHHPGLASRHVRENREGDITAQQRFTEESATYLPQSGLLAASFRFSRNPTALAN